MAIIGVDILILVDLGDEETPDFQAVGGQRGATLTRTRNTVNVTSKDSSKGIEEFEYGTGNWSISADGVYVESEDGYEALVDAWENRKKVKVRWQEATEEVFEGTALVTSANLEGPYDGEATYSFELQGSGVPVPVV